MKCIMLDDIAVTDLDIEALVDNELDWENEKRVRACIEKTPCARRRYEELCRQKKLLRDWWRQFH